MKASPRKQPSSISELVGQLLVVGFDGAEMSAELASLLERIQPAGVILFARNIVNAQQTHRLLKDCQARVAQPLGNRFEEQLGWAGIGSTREKPHVLQAGHWLMSAEDRICFEAPVSAT
jgi:beta-glucosidase-like glycosyl hydrolase